MMAKKNNAVRRSHQIVKLLAGRYFHGISIKELAQEMRTSAANASRDMGLLADIGYAHKLENGRWSLTIRPMAIMQAFETHYQQLQNQMTETRRNIDSGAAREG
jgi:DNA-binding IclR family transcriptional regulator